MKDTKNKEDRGPLDLTYLIEQHRKDIWEYKEKEMEWIKTKNQLDGTKRIVEELSTKIVDLKKEIDRLAEENNNIRTIDSSHQETNGRLQKDNRYLAEQVETYKEILRKAGL